MAIERAVALESPRSALRMHRATPDEIVTAATTYGVAKITRPYLEALTIDGRVPTDIAASVRQWLLDLASLNIRRPSAESIGETFPGRNSRMAMEANLLVFGETESTDHDLILFVGKEPNNALGRAVTVGRYGDDWTASGKGTSCNFWNRMYSHAGSFEGMSANGFRGVCSRAGSSPLAVTDLSPLSLDGSYSVWEKRALRKRIRRAEFESHVRDVFSHTALIERVRLVWMVGHHRSGLDTGIPVFEAACRDADVPFAHTSALDSTRHTNARRLAQLGAAGSIVQEVVSGFLRRHEESAAS